MKVFIVGITGLLGYEIAKKYIDENYDVSGIARNKVIFSDEYFEKMHIVYDDINELSDDDIEKAICDSIEQSEKWVD